MPDDLRPDLPPSSTANRGRDALAAFKGDMRASLPLHPLEKAVLWIAILQVCSLPWMLGGMRPWAQFIALGLAVLAFALALLPRHYAGDYIRNESFTLYPHRKLVRWPIFWIGLIFFGYVLVQALNPAWAFSQGEKSWFMVPIPHIEWLPTGMRTPFAMMNTWRQMMIWGAPFLLICALWIGFTRRKSVTVFLSVNVINFTLFALLALAQRMSDAKQIYWSIKSANEFFGTFIYRNHGAAFLALGTLLTFALAAWVSVRAARQFKRSSPALLLGFLGCVFAAAVFVSYSRGAVITLALTLIPVSGYALVWVFRRRQENVMMLPVVIIALMVLGFSAFGLKEWNVQRTIDRMSLFLEDRNAGWESRKLATDATMDMWSEKRALGWGAGGFRFLFPRFQQEYPEILWMQPKRQRGFMFWEYAHNDWAQIPTEVGWAGASLILAGLGYGVVATVRRRRWLHPFTLVALTGCLATLVHARGEFLFYNPTILTLWLTLAVLALMVPRLDPIQSSTLRPSRKSTGS